MKRILTVLRELQVVLQYLKSLRQMRRLVPGVGLLFLLVADQASVYNCKLTPQALLRPVYTFEPDI